MAKKGKEKSRSEVLQDHIKHAMLVVNLQQDVRNFTKLIRDSLTEHHLEWLPEEARAIRDDTLRDSVVAQLGRLLPEDVNRFLQEHQIGEARRLIIEVRQFVIDIRQAAERGQSLDTWQSRQRAGEALDMLFEAQRLYETAIVGSYVNWHQGERTRQGQTKPRNRPSSYPEFLDYVDREGLPRGEEAEERAAGVLKKHRRTIQRYCKRYRVEKKKI